MSVIQAVNREEFVVSNNSDSFLTVSVKAILRENPTKMSPVSPQYISISPSLIDLNPLESRSVSLGFKYEFPGIFIFDLICYLREKPLYTIKLMCLLHQEEQRDTELCKKSKQYS